MTEVDWAVRLFDKSVLKQQKYKELTELLGPTDNLDCLDIGGDNGVISFMLRKNGGNWKSADLDHSSVEAIQKLVSTEVYQIVGDTTPFSTDEFDRVAIIDYLEHIPDDEKFIIDMHRILKPGGILVVNVPNLKNGILNRLRIAFGQTDEEHGHLRPGYSLEGIEGLLGRKFTIIESRTYSKFFSMLIDILIVGLVSILKRNDKEPSKKGQIVTQGDFQNSEFFFRIYSFIYPFIRLFSKLDSLLFSSSGYMLILSAQVIKEPE